MDVVLHPLTVNWGEYIRKDGNKNEGLVTTQSLFFLGGVGALRNNLRQFSSAEKQKSVPAKGESLADIVL